MGPLDHKKTRTDLQNVTARGPKGQYMPWEGAWSVHWSVWDTCVKAQQSPGVLQIIAFARHHKAAKCRGVLQLIAFTLHHTAAECRGVLQIIAFTLHH